MLRNIKYDWISTHLYNWRKRRLFSSFFYDWTPTKKCHLHCPNPVEEALQLIQHCLFIINRIICRGESADIFSKCIVLDQRFMRECLTYLFCHIASLTKVRGLHYFKSGWMFTKRRKNIIPLSLHICFGLSYKILINFDSILKLLECKCSWIKAPGKDLSLFAENLA